MNPSDHTPDPTPNDNAEYADAERADAELSDDQLEAAAGGSTQVAVLKMAYDWVVSQF